MPAVSMSEKLKHHQKSLLHGKHHVKYTNFYWVTWQRNTGNSEYHKVMQQMHLFFQIKYMVTKRVGRISMVPWLLFQLKMLQNIA